MANLNSTLDIKKSCLHRIGELTDGSSPYDDKAVEYINQIHRMVLSGGSELGIDVDEPWMWARAENPIILTLVVPYDSGSITLTNGSVSGVFTVAPTSSLVGYHLIIPGEADVYRIALHTAASTAFTLDGPYTGSTGSGKGYKAVKLEYDLVDDLIQIDSSNNVINFKEASAGAEKTATLTVGNYDPATLATHIGTQMTAQTAIAATYTCIWNSSLRKFTFSTSATFLSLLFDSGTNQSTNASEPLGYHQVDETGATTYTSENVVNGILRLVDPMICNNSLYDEGNIFGTDIKSLKRAWPILRLQSGIPTRYAISKQKNSGVWSVQFNKYPLVQSRIEIPYIAQPRDLQDSANSIPLLPREYRQILDYGAAYLIANDKVDDKAQSLGQLAATSLQGLVNNNRRLVRGPAKNHGRIVPRQDLMQRRNVLTDLAEE